MIAFDKFFTRVLPFVDHCSEPSMETALRRAAIDFCNRTYCWQTLSDLLDVEADNAEYDIECPANAAPVKIMSMTFDSQPVAPKNPDDLDALMPDWATATESIPRYYTQLDPDKFLLAPVPSESQSAVLRYRASFTPKMDARTLPDILFYSYADTIAAGALSLLKSETERSYYSPQEAMLYAGRFESGIDDAKVSVLKGFGRVPKRVRGQFF